MTFGERLQELRTRHGWSQRQLAEHIGTSGPIIGRYERGEMMPSIEIASKLSDVFGVTVDYLIGKTESTMIDQTMLGRLDEIERLDQTDRERLFIVIDALIRDAKVRRAYAA